MSNVRSKVGSERPAADLLEDTQALGELLNLIAHDLRNPLSALHSTIGYLEAVLATASPDTQEALEDALASSEALSQIIDNLDRLGRHLRPSRAQAGPAAPRSQRLSDLAQEALRRVKRAADSYEMTVEAGALAGCELEVLVEPEPFVAALVNLLRNGIQHGARDQPVLVELLSDDSRAGVVVSDGGLVLPDAAPFEARGQLAAKNEGTGRYSRGLGLYAARLAAGDAGAELYLVGGDRHRVELVAPRG